jgi:hypothetical protein
MAGVWGLELLRCRIYFTALKHGSQWSMSSFMPLDIGSIAQDSVPENYYRIVADRLKDGLKNQVGPKGGWDGLGELGELGESV